MQVLRSGTSKNHATAGVARQLILVGNERKQELETEALDTFAKW